MSTALVLTLRSVLRLATGLLLAALVAGCGSASAAVPVAATPTATFRQDSVPFRSPTETAVPAPAAVTPTPMVLPEPTVFVPAPLIQAELDPHAAPVDVPLELRIPALKVDAPVSAVGLTAASGMDAPQGPAGDPVWQKVFWYRGGAVPGERSTATIAGHVDDVLGRPAVFARLKDLSLGDSIIVHDTRNGFDVRFVVTSLESYTVQQADSLPVLTRIYGSGPVTGLLAQPAPDGLAHLTLITCDGTYAGGSYDHRLVVYATRS